MCEHGPPPLAIRNPRPSLPAKATAQCVFGEPKEAVGTHDGVALPFKTPHGRDYGVHVGVVAVGVAGEKGGEFLPARGVLELAKHGIHIAAQTAGNNPVAASTQAKKTRPVRFIGIFLLSGSTAKLAVDRAIRPIRIRAPLGRGPGNALR